MSAATQELEALIREGFIAQARRRLREINLQKLQRNDTLAFANLARRVGLARLSLKALNPIVRQDRRLRVPPSAAEKIEYSASLRNLGAVSKAREILATVELDDHPQARFQLALCLIAEWDYGAAIPVLENYLRSFKAPAYEACVGKINLLQALICEGELGAARKLAAGLRDELGGSRFALLRQRSIELGAQLEIAANDYDEALKLLAQADSLLAQAKESVYALTLAKWAAICESMKRGAVTPSLLEARDRAIQRGEWEIVRDCDFHIGAISGDHSLLTHVYFGTPFEKYRARIRALPGIELQLPDHYNWSGSRLNERAHVFDLKLAAEDRETDGACMPAGQALHRFLIALCRDFYRPSPLIAVFLRLFPGQYFNPDSSPNRVHQVAVRFRKWISESSLPLALEELSGDYRLIFSGPISISVPRDPLPLHAKEVELLRLRSLLASPDFGIREAEQAFGGSRSATLRLLRWAAQEGKLRLEGQTNRARYHWVG